MRSGGRRRFRGGDPEVLAMLGEAIVWANNGLVAPEAVGIFRRVLDARPEDPAARFHLALARAQAGEVSEAYGMWLALAADTPADAPWRHDLEALIRQAAEVLGVEPGAVPSGPAVTEAPDGPTADDMAAAAELSPEERMEMIRGMVEGLAARLEKNPDDPEGLAPPCALLQRARRAREGRRKRCAGPWSWLPKTSRHSTLTPALSHRRRWSGCAAGGGCGGL